MIIRLGQAQTEIRHADQAPFMGASVRQLITQSGGLAQFGADVETLQPGARSSDRHWHEEEDEFLLMLGGVATLVQQDGPTELHPGDAVCWPAGVANGHQIVNRSGAECSYLIAGTRLCDEVVHYPDLHQRLTVVDGHWQMIDDQGSVLREGQDGSRPCASRSDLAWHRANRTPGHTMVVRAGSAKIDRGTPEQGVHSNPFEAHLLSYGSTITQFGAFTETLAPGSRSSDRHWHEREDEFMLMLAGAATVVENDGPQLLLPGDAACWPAGQANGHQVLNRSDAACTYLIIGWRTPDDVVHYCEADRLYTRQNGVVARTRRDGSPLAE